MKYIIIPIIAFGLTLSMLFGIEYHCEGPERFPTYYGSPFIFMQESLGSSMEYYYSISGLALNTLVWSVLLLALRYGILKLIEIIRYKKALTICYKLAVALLLLFAFLNISMGYIGLGKGFNRNLNYWYWNFDQDAKDYQMECHGHWKFGSF